MVMVNYDADKILFRIGKLVNHNEVLEEKLKIT